jgi:predicted HD phosphohydrolase
MTDLATPMTQASTRAAFRTFEESTQDDWALITSHFPETQARVAGHALWLLQSLESDDGGFPVSRLQHSLQTAARAENGGENEEYVMCALLHDIGDTLAPMNHPSIAADMLKNVVSEGHQWMVLHHGIFQGYYFWHHLGMDRNTRDQFRDSPYYDLTDEFTAKYDQTAFDPDYVSPSLDYYEPMVRRLFAPKG